MLEPSTLPNYQHLIDLVRQVHIPSKSGGGMPAALAIIKREMPDLTDDEVRELAMKMLTAVDDQQSDRQ